jgi:hypothetical protein
MIGSAEKKSGSVEGDETNQIETVKAHNSKEMKTTYPPLK